MKKYLVVVEKTSTGFSAFSPDVPGCVATAKTKRLVEKRMQEAISFHLEGLKIEKCEIPKSHSYSTYLEIPAA